MQLLTTGKYYGQRNYEIAHGGFLLSKYDYTVEKTDWHYHENPYFMFVLHGNMIDSNAKNKTLCPTGSLMFNNFQEQHYGEMHSKQAAGFHLELNRKWFEQQGIMLDIFEGSLLIEHPEVHFLFMKLYHELLNPDKFSSLAVETIGHQICEKLSELNTKTKGSQPQWVSRLKELLHEDSSNVSLKYLSDQLGVHPVHLSRTASHHLSMNLGDYVRQIKLKNTIPLLLDSSESLTEIAYNSGFSDQSHFNRVFKSHFSMSPGTFRKQIGLKPKC